VNDPFSQDYWHSSEFTGAVWDSDALCSTPAQRFSTPASSTPASSIPVPQFRRQYPIEHPNPAPPAICYRALTFALLEILVVICTDVSPHWEAPSRDFSRPSRYWSKVLTVGLILKVTRRRKHFAPLLDFQES
jgi:hypothetical protein